ncbi:BAG family molecular chaperone regulator 5, mitochondrial [Sesamum alatum]|uniref:BAG family molecular chaperone regulator 5, mitochondrial n=1 Tax=Sesamum alatum TaxID=300844 RepID=A0AAE2CAF0_9LAMI|nr:BAG family molecular chaperone regulator 5, mitochondrial [Sesamum alatum]
MDDPFLRNNHWYQQPDPTLHRFSHSPSFRGVPVYHVDPDPETHLPGRPIKRPPGGSPGPRVVRIPVHFVGSEQVDRSGSALKIQKVFRGFLVRKWLKKIKDIRVQVDEIEEMLAKSEVVELVRRDERGRLRMNESLMSLLFKLDSICGVDSGVRACRKAVIRKAIALQERIDAVVAINLDCNVGEALDQEAEVRLSMGSSSLNESPHSVENDGNLEGTCIEYQEAERNDGEVEIIDVEVDHEVKVSESTSVQENLDLIEESVDGVLPERSNETGRIRAEAEDDGRRNGELLERVMESNEKMMRMMRELFEGNEAQTRMLNALMHRVELLEKAFVCDMMMRKKKKKKTKTMTKKRGVCDFI